MANGGNSGSSEGKSNLACGISPIIANETPPNKLAEGLSGEHVCTLLLSEQRVHAAMVSFRVWGCTPRGSPAFTWAPGGGVGWPRKGTRQGDQ